MEMHAKDVWRFTTTKPGERSVITVSMTLQQKLLVMDSASGMLCTALRIVSVQFSMAVFWQHFLEDTDFTYLRELELF